MPKTPTTLKNRLHNAILITKLTPRQEARFADQKARRLAPMTTIDKKPKPVPELLAKLTNRQLIDFTGVHFTTVYRWRRQNELPPHIEKLLRFVALHELDQLGWKDWKIENGQLISPNGDSYDPGQVNAISLRQQELAFYKSDRRKLIYTRDQPSPHDHTDKFLAEQSERLRMRFSKEPHPVEIDDLEEGAGTKPGPDPDEFIREDQRLRREASTARKRTSTRG